jgi:acetyl esterase/lipase
MDRFSTFKIPKSDASPLFSLPIFRKKSGIKEIFDVIFGEGGNHSLRLNIARPEKTSINPMPAIVFIHGGGWIFGDYKGYQNYIFAAKGYFTVNIEYRLSTEAPFPAQIFDCKAAIRWIRANAKKYNVDSERIGVWGASAGGHLAALLGTSGDVPELEGEGGSNGFSSKVHAVLDWFGATDLFHLYDNSSIGPMPKISRSLNLSKGEPDAPGRVAVNTLLGGSPYEKPALARMASPMTYVSPNNPPFLIIHGEKDRTAPYEQSEMLHKSLRANNVESRLVIVRNAKHGFRADDTSVKVEPSREEIIRMTIDFFDNILVES